MMKINGLATSELGIAIVKKCTWCTCIIYPHQKVYGTTFCSKDCMQDNSDEKRVRSYRKQICEYKHNKRNRSRTEYYKKYYKENKKRMDEKSVKAMRRFRAKKKVELVELKDK